MTRKFNSDSHRRTVMAAEKKKRNDADGGPRSRVRTAGHSAQPPIDVSGNFFLPKFLLFFFRSPCKIWEPYDNPFWKNSDGGRKKEREKRKEEKREKVNDYSGTIV